MNERIFLPTSAARAAVTAFMLFVVISQASTYLCICICNSIDTNALAWFQYGGDTYVVQDVSPNTSFLNGTDKIIKITGAVDLSTSSFNTTQGTVDWI